MKRFVNLLFGFMIGAAFGALFALLFAPMPGSDLRIEARSRIEKTVSDVRTAVEEERKRLEGELEAFKRGEIQIG